MGEAQYNIAEKIEDDYQKKEILQSAFDNFQKANQISNNQNIFVLSKISEILNELGEYSEGIEYANKAISLKPDYANAYYALGKNLFETKDFYKAIESFKSALDYNENSDYENDKYKFLNELVKTFYTNRDFVYGIETLSKYMDIFEDNSLIKYNIFYFIYLNGDLKKAKNYFLQNNKINQFKKTDELYVILGNIEMRLNNFADALKYLSNAQKINPENGYVYYYECIIYYQQGNCKKAFETLKLVQKFYEGSYWELEDDIKRNCNPEKYVKGQVEELHDYVNENGEIETQAVKEFIISFHNQSEKKVTKIMFEFRIEGSKSLLFNKKYVYNVSLDTNEKLRYDLKLEKQVYDWENYDAHTLNYIITIIEVK